MDLVGLFRSAMRSVDAHQRQQRQNEFFQQYVISLSKEGYLGSDALNMKFVWSDVKEFNGFLLWSTHEIKVLTTLAGELLLDNIVKIENLSNGIFIVHEYNTVSPKNRYDGYLYNTKTRKTSEAIFKANIMSKFNEFGYAVLSTEMASNVIVDDNFKILIETESFAHPYVIGIVAKVENRLINLRTKEIIIDKVGSYNSTENKIFVFQGVLGKQVCHIIDKSTGEHVTMS